MLTQQLTYWGIILFGLFWGYLYGYQRLGIRAPRIVRLLCVLGGGIFGFAGATVARHEGSQVGLLVFLAFAAVLAMIGLGFLYGFQKIE